MKFLFKNIPPSKKNSRQIFCRGKYPVNIPSKRYQEWHEAEMWNLKRGKPKKPFEKCAITCHYYFPNNRRHDLSNIFESLADLLVDAGYLIDDSWQFLSETHNVSCGIDKENPRVEMEITKTAP